MTDRGKFCCSSLANKKSNQNKTKQKTTFDEQEAAGSGTLQSLQSRGLGFPSEGHLYLNNYLENSMLLENFFGGVQAVFFPQDKFLFDEYFFSNFRWEL